MLDIDIIIPCYGRPELIDRGLASIATQWKREKIHVTMVNDCSPHTEDDYADLVDRYKHMVDIRCIRTPKNGGQGLARQWGIDHTDNDWIFFMDEDDQLGSGIAASCFCNPVEANGLYIREDGSIEMGPDGRPRRRPDAKKVAVVTGPLFEFDDFHTHVIPASNTVWPTAKLYNREFIERHGIRFNERQSRHAEDYYFTSCFFHALAHDDDYVQMMLDDDGMYYIWYPNEDSQSRSDPHYGHMLAGYTMDGSVNILKYMKDTGRNKLKWDDAAEKEWRDRALNMTVYSWYTFVSFLDRFYNSDFDPSKKDWVMLRDACDKLRKIVRDNWGSYAYYQVVDELYAVRNMSDVQWCVSPNDMPRFRFEEYVMEGVEELSWSIGRLRMSRREGKSPFIRVDTDEHGQRLPEGMKPAEAYHQEKPVPWNELPEPEPLPQGREQKSRGKAGRTRRRRKGGGR